MALHALLPDPRFRVTALLTTVTEGFERISMHGVRRELLRLQADSIGLPLTEVRIPPQCPNTLYESRMAEACLGFRGRGIDHIAFGDIFLRDLRAYREKNLAELEMHATFPLWDIDTRQLAARFIADGFRGVTVCIDPKKLDPSFAGRQLDACFFEDLPAGIDPCGENGEFHTFVYDGPMFRRPLAIDTGEVRSVDGFIYTDLLCSASCGAL